MKKLRKCLDRFGLERERMFQDTKRFEPFWVRFGKFRFGNFLEASSQPANQLAGDYGWGFGGLWVGFG